jgi:hypothetical protein
MGGYDVQTGRSLCPVQVPADKVTALRIMTRSSEEIEVHESNIDDDGLILFLGPRDKGTHYPH